eukprot:TRINITY_DN2730_c0_g3_i1.p1 TRINITY_DN2730_c0_g3~~TRINITY_DN2730_c0_g3_i1.p1  ORF type:complete len:506 (+),score=113.52 TRINITY_DN2730_c0_g3_i1:31-1548(+)
MSNYGVKIKSSWAAKEGGCIPSEYVTWEVDEEDGLPETVTSVPDWCKEGIVLTKPASGQRCELLISFTGVHEILECEVVSSARIVELYGTTEDEGDCYWQSSRSKEGFDNLWHCPALLPQAGTRRVSASPLVIKLFSLSPPTTACTLKGVRVRISSKGGKKPTPSITVPQAQAPSLHEMVSLAAKFLKGGGSLSPKAAPPEPSRPAPQPSPVPQSATSPLPSSPEGTIQVPLTTITLMQQQMKETSKEYEKRMVAMEERLASIENRILPKVESLVAHVVSLQAEVDALKGQRDKDQVREKEKEKEKDKERGTPTPKTPATPKTPVLSGQTPSLSSLGTPGTPSKRLMEVREERRRERQSCPPGLISPVDEKKLLAEFSRSKQRFASATRSSSVPTERHDITQAKRFFGFTTTAEFRDWVEKAAFGPKAQPPVQQIDGTSPATTPERHDNRDTDRRQRSSSHGGMRREMDEVKPVRSPSDIPVRGVMACQRKAGLRSPNNPSFQLS